MNKNSKTLLIILGVVIGMVGLSFASVPAYRLFCKVTGFGGTTMLAKQAPNIVLERTIKVQFNTDTSPALPWDFKPDQRSVTVNIGQEALISFTALNRLKTPAAGTAVYNVTPLSAGKYFNKTQCFCFNEQTLNPGESVHMPVSFFIDPKIAEDRSMDGLEVITLSYTFFPAESEELDAAIEAFYNSQ